MNSKGIIIVASVILVLILAPISIYFLGSGTTTAISNISSSTSSKVATIKSTIPIKGITLTEVAKHNTQSDCYMIVNKKVYNVTSYLQVHPGGSFNIIEYCGKDGTRAFDTKGGQGQHSNRAGNDLSSLYVGDLAI